MNYFLTFADSHLGGSIRNPRKRIRRQAESMGVFGENIYVLTEQDLDDDFRERMKEHLVFGSRGYGYWCWKPQIVLQILREMDIGDIVLYADVGCHLNPKGLSRLREYFELAKKHGIVAFQSRTNGSQPKHFLKDREWCKGDLLEFFGVRNDHSVIETGQLGGTAFLVCKKQETEEFFIEFRNFFYDHFNLCDDSPSITENLSGFVENRHDQSVFSLLGKKYGIFSLSSCEYDSKYINDGQLDVAAYPIWAKHDKGGWRSLFPSWFKNLVHFITWGKI